MTARIPQSVFGGTVAQAADLESNSNSYMVNCRVSVTSAAGAGSGNRVTAHVPFRHAGITRIAGSATGFQTLDAGCPIPGTVSVGVISIDAQCILASGMPDDGETVFETAWVPCLIEWTWAGVKRVVLPGGLRAGGQRSPVTIPAFVSVAVERIRTHLGGTVRSFNDLPLDMRDLTPFTRAVLEIMRRISTGSTLTYGEIARRMGRTRAARAVGRA